mmetsp:Transcript_40698/g.56580  ORF Transcript_40698/g.56580 Transcript_40698/m.56580 type:complete len:111 (-) Transcript_40698:306-638(-)
MFFRYVGTEGVERDGPSTCDPKGERVDPVKPLGSIRESSSSCDVVPSVFRKAEVFGPTLNGEKYFGKKEGLLVVGGDPNNSIGGTFGAIKKGGLLVDSREPAIDGDSVVV